MGKRNDTKSESKKDRNNIKVHNLKLKDKLRYKKTDLKVFKKFSHGFNTMELLKKADFTFALNDKLFQKEKKLKTCKKKTNTDVFLNHEKTEEGELENSLQNVKPGSTFKDNDHGLLKQLRVMRIANESENDNAQESLFDDGNALDKFMWKDFKFLRRICLEKRRMRRLQNRRNRQQNLMKNNVLEKVNLKLNSKVDLHPVNENHVLLSMSHPFSLYFTGVFNIKVLTGKIEITGFVIDQQSEKRTIYSPRGTNQLNILTKESGCLDEATLKNLSNFGVSKQKMDEITSRLNGNFVVAILEKHKSNLTSMVWPNFVQKYSDHKLMLPVSATKALSAEGVLQSKFEVNSQTDKKLYYQKSPEWDSIMEHLSKGYLRIAVCGGKGVGKSTLLRYLINQSLLKWESVLVIDCDPGQSEFFVPGCISAVLVKSPLLGPNFTHLIKPEKSIFVGEIDVLQNPTRFIHCVEYIIEYCKSEHKFKNIPWFINTMGFSKGFGVVATSTVLKKTSPSLVVQIRSENKKLNFPSSLTPQFIVKNLFRATNYNDCEKPDYKLLEINSAFRGLDPRKDHYQCLSSTILRTVMILTYFGNLLNSNVRSIYDAVPYMVDYTKVNLSVVNQTLDEESVLDALNGNMVALCHRSLGEGEYNSCLGFGIVRGIDKKKKQLFLLTPLSVETLSNVNRLVKGSVYLPDKLYLDPSMSVLGHIPYVVNSASQLRYTVKRKYQVSSKDNN